VDAETTGDYIRLTGDAYSGIFPLETTPRVGGSFSFEGSSFTDTGSGVVEVLESTPEEYREG